MLTTDGCVFQWGDMICVKEEEIGVRELSFVSGSDMRKERIIQIACGEAHALALTSKGQVYSWGSNGEGQLGIGDDIFLTGQPTQVSGVNEFHPRIAQIACGDWTSFALDKEGSVSRCGLICYSFYQLKCTFH